MKSVYESLCYKDERNLLYYVLDEDNPPTPRDNCSCDNCFYGRDELALYILFLEDKILNMETSDMFTD